MMLQMRRADQELTKDYFVHTITYKTPHAALSRTNSETDRQTDLYQCVDTRTGELNEFRSFKHPPQPPQ